MRWKERHAAGEKTSWPKLNAELNARKTAEFPWMYELPWAIPNKALTDLGSAFGHFFRRVKAGERKVGYPKFKKKGRCREGFAVEGRAVEFDGRRVKIPKLGWIRMRESLRFPGKVLSVRFTKRAGRWYVSAQIEINESLWSYPHRCKTQAVVGMDLGVVDLAVLSDGPKIPAPRVLRRLETHLRRLNKQLHRRRKGGKNRQKTRLKLARLHERIANVRRDVTHKLTARLVRDFRWIGVEDLNVAGMIQNRRLAKSVVDAAMAEVRHQLVYKAPLAGSNLVVADRWYPSSKTCSNCGYVMEDLSLDICEWTCPACGAVHDRNRNAAINLKNLAAAYAATACRQGSSGVHQDVKLPLGQEVGSWVFN